MIELDHLLFIPGTRIGADLDDALGDFQARVVHDKSDVIASWSGLRVDARGLRGVVGQRIIDRGDDLIRIVTAQFVPARYVSGMLFIERRLILAAYAP